MEPIVFLYVTAPDGDCANKIADALVREELAACVNIHGEITSTYRWQGEIRQGREVALIVKTTAAAALRARERILALHPDETPCVAAIPVDAAASSAPFMQWIAASIDA